MQCEGVVGADGWVSLYPQLSKPPGAKVLIECAWHNADNDDARKGRRDDQRRHPASQGKLGGQ